MKRVDQHLLDEIRQRQLIPIAEKFNKSIPQIIDLALDEFIAKHQIPAKAEPPTETVKDKYHRGHIEQLSHNMGLSPTLVRREIMQLSAIEIAQKYRIHQRSLGGFREYIKRTSS
jgi:hypothetical protein